MSAKFEVVKKEGNARRGVFETVHGTVQTPAFIDRKSTRLNSSHA